MPYEIGYAPKDDKKVRSARPPTAREALRVVRNLQASDEEIRYIKAPFGAEIGIAELELDAEREGSPNA